MTPTIVFFGDSITEGRIGASYVERVRTQLGGAAHVINAGINGDTVVNLRRRVLRDIAPHRPDIVVVMVGLNDIGTVYARPFQRTYYQLLKGNEQALTIRRFAAGYRDLIHDLRRQTGAQIVLSTPTTLTEQPDKPVQPIVDAYAAVVWALADQEGLKVIDVRSAFRRAIHADPRPGPDYQLERALGDMLAIRFRGVTYAELAVRRGYRLLVDGVHLSEAGAELIAQVMVEELRGIVAHTGFK
jgi:acyl-CoA thioesterase-1